MLGRLGLVGVSLLLALTACGGDEEGETGGTAGPSSTDRVTEYVGDGQPIETCEHVWITGQPLPEGAFGDCFDRELDTMADISRVSCSDGTQLTSYADTYWVLGDGEIAKAADGGLGSDPDYTGAHDRCTG